LIAHEYGYPLEYIAGLTPFQIGFLAAWLEWARGKSE